MRKPRIQIRALCILQKAEIDLNFVFYLFIYLSFETDQINRISRLSFSAFSDFFQTIFREKTTILLKTNIEFGVSVKN